MIGALAGGVGRRGGGRRTAAARGRSSSSSVVARPCRPPRSSGCARCGGRASPSRRRACATSAASASTCSATGCSTTCRSNGDRFLIGRFLGTAALGIYAVAYNTMLVPASKLGGPLQRVFSPAFSRIQDEPERIAAAWARVARLLAAVSVPALAGLVVVAPDFVPARARRPVDRGRPGRSRSSPGSGSSRRSRASTWTSCMARGRARTMFRFSRRRSRTCHLVAFAVGLDWGVVGVAVAYAISTTLVEPVQTVLAARALGVSPMVFVRAHLRRLPGRARHVRSSCSASGCALVDAGVAAALRLVVCIRSPAPSSTARCAPGACRSWPARSRALLRRRAPAPAPLVPAAPPSPELTHCPARPFG